MKTFIKLIILVLIANKSARAQTEHVLEVGAQFGSITSKNTTFTNSISNLTVGAYIKYNFHTNIALKAKFNYDVNGGYRSSFPRNEYELKYLTIPILLEPNINFGRFNFFVNCGPFVGLYESGSITTFTFPNSYFEVEADDFIYNADFGGVFGIGLSIRVHKNVSVVLETAKTVGLIDISTKNGTIKSSTFAYTSGLKIGL